MKVDEKLSRIYRPIQYNKEIYASFFLFLSKDAINLELFSMFQANVASAAPTETISKISCTVIMYFYSTTL